MLAQSAFFKRSTHVFVIAFWVFTWHSYAFGAIERTHKLAEEQSQTLWQSSDEFSVEKAQPPLKFKRRPFITKADAIKIEPVSSTVSTLPVGHVFLPKDKTVVFQVYQAHLLRSPPALA